MNDPARKVTHTFAEYLEAERASDTKHEFVNGEIFAMAGGTSEHARLAARAIITLGAQLRGRRCEVFSADIRIRVRATDLATYPDVSVVCSRIERDPEDKDSITNPIVLIEVLSSTTEAYDRGSKFAHYRRIPSLKEYVLISQYERRIEVFRRNADESWTLVEAVDRETLKLLSIDCVLDLEEIYVNTLEEQPDVTA